MASVMVMLLALRMRSAHCSEMACALSWRNQVGTQIESRPSRKIVIPSVR